MAKAKTATEKVNGAAEEIETVMKNGTEALKANFEKAAKSYDQFLGYGKDTRNVEAYVKAATGCRKRRRNLP